MLASTSIDFDEKDITAHNWPPDFCFLTLNIDVTALGHCCSLLPDMM